MARKSPARPLDGQVAVVAGATRGAGRGIARALESPLFVGRHGGACGRPSSGRAAHAPCETGSQQNVRLKADSTLRRVFSV